MNIVIAQGGLGNIMFQYAFCCTLDSKYKSKCTFLVSKMSLHHGVRKDELLRIFNIDRLYNLNSIEKLYITLLENIREKQVPYKLLFFHKKAIRLESFSYNFIFDKKNVVNTYFLGGWQSEKFFYPIKDNIKHIFQFNKSLLNSNTIQICKRINNTNSVSIHLRRGGLHIIVL